MSPSMRAPVAVVAHGNTVSEFGQETPQARSPSVVVPAVMGLKMLVVVAEPAALPVELTTQETYRAPPWRAQIVGIPLDRSCLYLGHKPPLIDSKPASNLTPTFIIVLHNRLEVIYKKNIDTTYLLW
jgi:hypothetical protein